jgi:hypothetical protein
MCANVYRVVLSRRVPSGKHIPKDENKKSNLTPSK